MFKKDDKVKVVKGIKAFEGLTGTVLDTNGNQVKVKLNLSNDSELQKNLINVFEAYQLELESLDLLKEDNVSFDNDVEQTVNEEEKKFLDKDKAMYIIDYLMQNHLLDTGDKEELDDILYNRNNEVAFNHKLIELGIKKDFDKEYNKPVEESLKLTAEELKAWCSDNDANYYTQDIKDDKVIIRGLNEDLAEYNFKTKELKVFDYSGTKTPETKEDEDDANYIRDYVYDIDMIDEKTEIPSWEFASIIATAEDTTEDAVVTEAHDRGFKVFLITASEYEKLVIASEKITEEDIMNDFAAYLEGNPKVTEVI